MQLTTKDVRTYGRTFSLNKKGETMRVTLFILLIFLVSGCGTNDPIHSVTPSPNINSDTIFNLLEERNYKEAYELLRGSYQAGQLNEAGIQLYENTRTTYYEESYRAAFKAIEDKNYDQAIEHLRTVQYFLPENEEISEYLTHSIRQADKQKSFDLYLSIFIDVNAKSNELLTIFNSNLDNLFTNQLSDSAFISETRKIIPQSNQIVTKLDSNLYELDEELLTIHLETIALIDFQHNMFLKALSIGNDSYRNIESELRSDFLSVKKRQTEQISRIKNYATNNSLNMNKATDI